MSAIAIIILAPFVYLGSTWLLVRIIYWIFILVSLMAGDKSVIYEFDCRKRESGQEDWFDRMLEQQMRDRGER